MGPSDCSGHQKVHVRARRWQYRRPVRMGHFKEASNWCDGGGVSHSCGPCPRPAFCPATPCPPLLLCSTPFLGPIASCLLLCWCAVRFTSSSRLAIEQMSTCTHASVRTSSPHMCDNGGPGGLHLSACFSPARLWLRRGGGGFGGLGGGESGGRLGGLGGAVGG